MAESIRDQLHDHVGAWIDPLLASGVGLHALTVADGATVVPAAVLASLLLVVAVVYQPVRSVSDRVASVVATTIATRSS